MTPSKRRSPVAAALMACGLSLPGCGSRGDPPTVPCVSINAACMPLYPPTFANIFSKTLSPTCAQGTGTCHSDDSRKAGLYFVDSAMSYELLLGMGPDRRARVLPDDPGCSILAERLESTNPAFRMPPGTGLTAPELCVFVQWMASGAPQF